jgi:hypothetical protein
MKVVLIQETDHIHLKIFFKDRMIYNTPVQMMEKGSGRELNDMPLLMELLVHRVYGVLDEFRGEMVTEHMLNEVSYR